MIRRHLARLAAGVLTGALLLPGAPAASGSASALADACVGSSGVTVVVDFSAFGQGIPVVCLSSVPSTGLGALRAAGFSTAGTTHDGPGYVCRINGLPTADAEACVVTPPTTAYWSYWHAARGGSWAYSTSGAAGYHPEPGSVEGWAFGSGGRPGIAPPAPIAEPAPPPPPAPQPTTARPPAGGGGGGGGDTGGATDPGSPAAESPSADPSVTASASTSAAVPSSTVGEVADPPPPPGDDDSGVLGTAVGLVLVAGLAAAALTVALRRRRALLVGGPSSTDSVNKGPFLSSDPEG